MARDIQSLKIDPDSLIEALAEVRFKSADLPDIVPAKLSLFPRTDSFVAQRLSHADMPLPIRQMDPTLSVMPILQKVSKDGRRVAKFGEQVFSWHALGAYPGWSVFKPELVDAMQFICTTIKKITFTRVGLRYVNAFTPKDHHITSLTDLALDIEIAGKPLNGEFNLNYMSSSPGMHTIVKIATPEFVQGGGQSDFSLIMDIDVSTPSDFLCEDANQLLDWLDKAHMCLKTEFYAVIPDGVLTKLRVG